MDFGEPDRPMQPLARDHDFARYKGRKPDFPRDGPRLARLTGTSDGTSDGALQRLGQGVLVRDCTLMNAGPTNAATAERYCTRVDARGGELAAMAQRPCFGGSPNASRHVQPTGALAVLMGAHQRLGARQCIRPQPVCSNEEREHLRARTLA